MEEICVKITDGIYIGTFKTSMSKVTLIKNNISHILCVGSEMENIFKDEYRFMKLDVTDTDEENILFNFDLIYNFIEEGRLFGGILIHCFGGISRSPTITIAYFMKKQNLNFREAFDFVKSKKPNIKPNEGFLEKLKYFERSINLPIQNYYKCLICRRTLFDDSKIDFAHKLNKKIQDEKGKNSISSIKECTSYFQNNLSLVTKLEQSGGKIKCPNKNCNNEIGQYSLKSLKCSCGGWVTPVVQIFKSKIKTVSLTNKLNFGGNFNKGLNIMKTRF